MDREPVRGDVYEPRVRKKYGSGRKKRGSVLLWILLILLLLLAAAGVIAYLIGNRYFQEHFSYGTTINGVSVYQMTEDEVKALLSSKLEGYELTVTERTGDGGNITEVITGEDVGLHLDFDDTLKKKLESQGGLEWIKAYRTSSEVEMEPVVVYDPSMYKAKIDSLQCFQDSFVVKPKDASLSDYQEGVGYVLTEEVQGNQLTRKIVEEALEQAVLNMETDLDLNDLDCYKKPAITKDDPALVKKKEALEKYTSVTITYDFGYTDEVVDGDMIHSWLKVDSAGNVTLDSDKIADFVAGLRKKYDTIFRTHTFETYEGVVIELEDGDYGWWMNYTREAQELQAMIEAGESGERTPVYYQTAAQYGSEDYGDTYVEVNLTAQHMYFWENGDLVLESDFVSGNSSRNFDTPEGVYGITYKQRNATLVGENYETPVSYWMPFNGNVGLHDATWRSSFGSDIYMSSGSHGCVNLPYLVAKELYSRVSQGTAVIVYSLEGTESDSVTEQSAEDIAQSAIDAINAIGDVTKDSKDLIERARELYDDLNGSERSYVYNYDVLKEAEEEFKQYPTEEAKESE